MYPEHVTEQEIEDFIGDLYDHNDQYPSGKYRGMTYEEGLRDALFWISGDSEKPEL